MWLSFAGNVMFFCENVGVLYSVKRANCAVKRALRSIRLGQLSMSPNIALFFENVRPFCGNIRVFCGNIRFFCWNIRFFCESCILLGFRSPVFFQESNMLCQKSPTLSKIRPVIHESQCSSLFRKCEALLRKYLVLLRRFRSPVFSQERSLRHNTCVNRALRFVESSPERISWESTPERLHICVTRAICFVCQKSPTFCKTRPVIHASQCTSLLRKYTNLLLNCRALLRPHDIFGDKIQSMHI